jgi:hypothetical protein
VVGYFELLTYRSTGALLQRAFAAADMALERSSGETLAQRALPSFLPSLLLPHKLQDFSSGELR